MHKLGFSFETVDDEKRNEILEAIIELFDDNLDVGEKVALSYSTKAVQGRTKVKVDRTLEWIRGEPAPTLLDMGIENTQRSMLSMIDTPAKRDVMRPIISQLAARPRTPDGAEWATEDAPIPNL